MKKQILLFALLCAVVQGAWAQISYPIVYNDVWDGRLKIKGMFYK